MCLKNYKLNYNQQVKKLYSKASIRHRFASGNAFLMFRKIVHVFF